MPCISQTPLPKLPVPELLQTLSKYLLSIRAVVAADVFERTRSVVEEFGATGGDGEKLQKRLEQFAENTECWVSKY